MPIDTYKSLIEVLPQKIFLKDINSVYISCNENFANDLGIDPSEIKGKTDYDFFPHHLADKYRLDDQRIIHCRKTEQLDEQYVQNGEHVIIRTVKTPVFDDEQQVTGIMGIFWDVTDEVKAQQALQQSNARIKSIFRAAPVGIGVVIDRIFTDVNEFLCSMLGYTREQLLGKDARMIYSNQEDYEYVGREKYRQLQNNSIGTVETRWLRKDGQTIEVLLSSSPLNPDDWSQGLTFTALDITESKHAEKELKLVNERLEMALSGADMGMWDWDVDSMKVVRNDRILEMLGYDKNDEIPKEYDQLMHPDDRVAVSKAMRAHLQGKTPIFQAEFRVRTKSGEWKWILSRGRAFEKSPDGTAHRVVGTNLDITERKNAEQQLKLVNQRLELTINAMNMGMWDWDLRTNKVVRSNRVLDILGHSQEQLEHLEENFTTLVHPDDRQREKQIMEDHIKGKTPIYEAEYRIMHHSGQYRWILSQGKAVERDANGRALRIVGTNLDITDRKLAEQELKITHERLQLALKGADLGMWDWDARTNKTIRSDRLVEMLGYTHEEISRLDGNYSSLVHPDDREPSGVRWLDHYYGKTEFFESEYRVLSKSGEYRWILTRGRAVERAPDRTALRVVGTNLDITERKQIQQQREALITQLEAKNAELERFVYTVSHDLKSPLITIRGYLGMLPQDIQHNNQKLVNEDIARIVNATDRMRELLDDLLELSRIGRQEVAYEQVPLSQLVYEALDLILVSKNANRVDVQIDPDLPEVLCERSRIREVFQNLLDNAIKFTSHRENPRITVGRRNDQDQTVYFVQDNGLGLNPGYADKVFELFHKLSPNDEGTGIGLAIVKRIIEHHEGDIWVESEGENTGCTFCFTLGDRRNSQDQQSEH